MIKILIIANPVAGRGQGVEVAKRVETTLSRYATNLQFTKAASPGMSGSAQPLVERHAGDVDRLIIIGGDGTVRQVIAGLIAIDRYPKVAIVPLGNANVLAREFGISLEPDLAIRAVLCESYARVDVGLANDHVFLAVLGVGIDAVIIHFMENFRRTRIGLTLYRTKIGAELLYGLATVPALCQRHLSRFRARESASDRWRKFASIWVTNTRCYAKGWSLNPDTSPTDGLLSVRGEETLSLFRIAIILIGAMRHTRPTGEPVWLVETTSLSICADRPFSWQLDGDAMPEASELKVSIIPKALNLVLPN